MESSEWLKSGSRLLLFSFKYMSIGDGSDGSPGLGVCKCGDASGNIPVFSETFDSDECDKSGDRATGVLIETKPLMAWLEGPA